MQTDVSVEVTNARMWRKKVISVSYNCIWKQAKQIYLTFTSYLLASNFRFHHGRWRGYWQWSLSQFNGRDWVGSPPTGVLIQNVTKNYIFPWNQSHLLCLYKLNSNRFNLHERPNGLKFCLKIRHQVVRDELVKAKSEHYHNKLSEADNH